MHRFVVSAFLVFWGAFTFALPPADRGKQPVFKVTYVEVGTAYLDGGRNAGLTEGMTLVIRRARSFGARSGDGQFKGTMIIARLKVISVSGTSAMCQVHSETATILRGDLAELVDRRQPSAQAPPPGTQSLNQGMRTSVLAPAMATMGSESPQTVPTPAPTPTPAATPTAQAPPVSIADAARANRGMTAQPQHEASTPSATAPSHTIVASVPLSIAEEARARQRKAQAATSPGQGSARADAGAVSRAPDTTQSSAAKVNGTPSSSANQPGVAAANNPATPSSAAKPTTAETSNAASVPLSVAEAARMQRRAQTGATSPATATAPPTTGAANRPPDTSAPPKAAKVEGTPSSSTAAPAATAANSVTTPPPVKPATVENKVAVTAPPATTSETAAPTAPLVASKPQPANATAPASTANTAPVLSASAAQKKPPLGLPQATQQEPQVSKPASPTERKTAGTGSTPAATKPPAASAPAPVPPSQSSATASISPVTATPIPGKTVFSVKYVAEDAVYIDAGKNAGLSEGMGLTIKKADNVIAEVAVVSVSNSSAVCEIRNKTADIQRGDLALLAQADQDKMTQAQAMGPTRKYPQVIAFSQGDPLDEEARESVPKPPLPEINRARGRIGLDYSFIRNTGTGATQSSQVGAVVRADITRIGGSYWNLNGYWRGRLNSFSSSSTSPTQPQSVFDLINRTYTIGLTYVNPTSHFTAGVGRLYLPWAPSLDTVDGGYLGLKFGGHTTVGIFGGSTPDPTSFNYNPDRRTAGTFVAVEAGSFDKLRITSTEGVAVSAIQWREDRQFVFGENGLFYKRILSIYHSAQADIQRLPTGGTVEGLSRSFATLRVQPFSRFSIDVNHNYFRDVPTFDPTLVGTGLLDKFLFQGVSLGSRLELPWRISIYDNFGQSSRSGDPRKSINQLYGLTLGRLWKTGLRGDVRYSKFTSSFGAGNYRAASLSRSFGEVFRVEVNAGQQKFLSSIGATTNYKLLGSTLDLNLGGHYFIETGMNIQRSAQQNFEQWLVTTGYRFDTRKHR